MKIDNRQVEFDEWLKGELKVNPRFSNLKNCEGSLLFPNCRAEIFKPHPKTAREVNLIPIRTDLNSYEKDLTNIQVMCQKCAVEHKQGHKNTKLLNHSKEQLWKPQQIQNTLLCFASMFFLILGLFLSVDIGWCLAFQRSGAVVVAIALAFGVLSSGTEPKLQIYVDLEDTLSPQRGTDLLRKNAIRLWEEHANLRSQFDSLDDYLIQGTRELSKKTEKVRNLINSGRKIKQKLIKNELSFALIGTIVWAFGDTLIGYFVTSCTVNL